MEQTKLKPEEKGLKMQDLRIGNRILVKGKEVVVEGIQPWHVWTSIHTGMIFWKDTKPIPLTEDILKRIDWDGYRYLYINSNFCLDESGHLYYRNDYTGINVDYLHQLQNLYFDLKGTELTLKEQ